MQPSAEESVRKIRAHGPGRLGHTITDEERPATGADGGEEVGRPGDEVLKAGGTRKGQGRRRASRRPSEHSRAVDGDGDPTGYVDVLPEYGVVDAADADAT